MTREEIIECQRMLEATEEDVVSIVRTSRSVEEATQRLKELKKRGRKNLHKLALHLHPDINPDPDAHELFKKLLSVEHDLQSLEVQSRPRPQPQWRPMPVRQYRHVSWSSATASSSTNSADNVRYTVFFGTGWRF